jgi:hypothetical protein
LINLALPQRPEKWYQKAKEDWQLVEILTFLMQCRFLTVCGRKDKKCARVDESEGARGN